MTAIAHPLAGGWNANRIGIMAILTVDDHNKGVGAIVMNLQALETTLRFFFFRKNGEKSAFRDAKKGEFVPGSSLVSHKQLRKWIRQYNSCLTKEEFAEYSITEDIVEVRDALAHGRLLAREPPKLPYTLWNFKEQSNGKVEVRFHEVLTADWLKKTIGEIDNAKETVVACFKARGYKGLS